MKYLTLVRENIRRQRGSFLGILALIFMISVLLCAVLTIWSNSNGYEREQVKRVGYGDLTAWLGDNVDVEELRAKILDIEAVGSAETEAVISARFLVNGTEAEDSLELITGDGGYYIFNDAMTEKLENPEPLGSQEIYVPAAFRTLHGLKPGDMIELEIAGKEDTESFTVKGFFEDVVSGSAMMGMKRALVSEAAMERIGNKLETAEEETVSRRGWMLHISMKEGAGLTQRELQEVLNKEAELSDHADSIYTQDALVGFMLILMNLVFVFLLVFVAVLTVAAYLVISHNISAGIEQEYTDMGVLKALGYTGTDLRRVKLMQYLAAVLVGMAAGVPASVPVVKLINRLIVPATGIMIPTRLPAGLCLAVLALMSALLALGIALKTADIGRITPIRAIRGGAQDVCFQSRGMLPICGRGLAFHLALRQLTAGRKQYVSAGLITVLLVFVLSLSERIGNGLGDHGEILMDMFGASPYDIAVKAADGEAEEARELIASYTGIVAEYESQLGRTAVNGVNYLVNIIEKPEYLNMLKGRPCLYDNELVVTEMVSEELGITIGDTVRISCAGDEKEFIVTGTYQCANDMGENIALSKAGYLRISEEGAAKVDGTEEPFFWDSYILEDGSKAQEIADRLEEVYGRLNL